MSSTVTDQRIVLITGAAKGIGLATARYLGSNGFLVLVGARREEAAEAAAAGLRADGIAAEPIRLDVTDDDSVERSAEWLKTGYGRLDALVNNAAVKVEPTPHPPSMSSVAAMRETFETNVFGAARMILTMLPLLRMSRAPRIVNVSSGSGSLTLASTPGSSYMHNIALAYNTSKAALNGITVQFAAELRHEAFKVNSVNPGHTLTEMTTSFGDYDGRSADVACVAVAKLVMLGDDGPTGSFFNEDGVMPW